VDSPAPHRGKVFSYKDFEFVDGGKSDKLLILVNEPKGNADCIFIKTTSKPKPQSKPGCHSFSNLYVLDAGEDLFKLKTWVQFQEIYPVTCANLLSVIKAGEARRIGCLRDQTVRAIINCMRNSPDLSPYELKLLK
jgi:hypothetical protein